jgi:diaminohydroxyphosphoribosylaminopyrimidine deaminase/5-amino-6-(5-phosphoribosylamino)uracil reductase
MVHEEYMRRCIELAYQGGKLTKSNPNVGCIIVHQDKIIGEGYHKHYGGHHAEVEALLTVQDSESLKEATMYVSLEPCCHTNKKTPPCTSLIIEKGIRKVVISALDPNPEVSGKGVQILKSNGIEVLTGILENEGLKLIQKFKANLQQRPYIILKTVKSEDGYIGSKDKQIWLTNEYTNMLTHRWRSETDAILVGTNTVLTDNPSLTTRNWNGNHPVRVIWDKHLRIPLSAKVFDGSATVFVLNQMKTIEKDHFHYINVNGLNLDTILKLLFKSGITSIIVEGGSITQHEFIKQNLWDEARVITTPHRLEKSSEELIKAPDIQGVLEQEISIKGDRVQIIHNK